MPEHLWLLLLIQITMGALDTLYHHELTERLAWRPRQAVELRLHSVRNLAYAVAFVAIGWSEPRGLFAVALLALMAGELAITLWDFVEEDRTRRLPETERLLHTLLTLNYGALLAVLVPALVRWAGEPTSLAWTNYGVWSWVCALAAAGVLVCGLRDMAVARRAPRLAPDDARPLAAALTGRKSVLVTGATGLIGRRLVAALAASGHDVTALVRSPATAALPAPVRIVTSLDQVADGARLDAVVNLAGEPISNGFWTAKKRRSILRSRLKTTRAVVRMIARQAEPPPVLVSASAIGWYGLRGDEALTETADARPCFSHTLCDRWEKEALKAAALGARVVTLRIGLVLALDGGMLSRMLTPFEFGLGGRFGTGKQWMSWIDLDDVVRMIVHAIATPHVEGPLNATAPRPVRNSEMTSTLARALGRWAILPAPAAPLRLALGDFADELLLSGQRVLPEAALRSGFVFDKPELQPALERIVGLRPAPQALKSPARRASGRAAGRWLRKAPAL
jgi:hypothetical protein